MEGLEDEDEWQNMVKEQQLSMELEEQKLASQD